MSRQFSPRFGMNRAPRGNVAEVARLLVAERNGGEPADVVFDAENQLAINDAKALIDLAKRAHRWAELHCNGVNRRDEKTGMMQQSWTDEDEVNKDRSDAQVLAEAMSIAQRYNVKGVRLSGDPRGFVLHLELHSGRYNTWGGREAGFGIANSNE